MNRCNNNCGKLAHPELDGYCVGCFYWSAYIPIQKELDRLREKFTTVLLNIPAKEFEILKTQAHKHITEREV